mmetsp:Transcript_25661/g.74199  ORF Transcript_25661/g.74199 Transcript_25661/m.74199 type:complete len:222 (+) Transcript_25661:419-1084(+)
MTGQGGGRRQAGAAVQHQERERGLGLLQLRRAPPHAEAPSEVSDAPEQAGDGSREHDRAATAGLGRRRCGPRLGGAVARLVQLWNILVRRVFAAGRQALGPQECGQGRVHERHPGADKRHAQPLPYCRDLAELHCHEHRCNCCVDAILHHGDERAAVAAGARNRVHGQEAAKAVDNPRSDDPWEPLQPGRVLEAGECVAGASQLRRRQHGGAHEEEQRHQG